jgi:hypothetical protein
VAWAMQRHTELARLAERPQPTQLVMIKQQLIITLTRETRTQHRSQTQQLRQKI